MPHNLVDREWSQSLRLAYKYRLYPTKAQAEFLEGQLREAASLYNDALQERKDAWKTCRKSLNYYDQANQLKAIRAEGLISLANFSCCQDVLRRVDKTYKAFFARCKRGDKPGFPRYRSVRRYDSITFPSYGDGCRLLDNGKLRIQGTGHIKVKLHRPVEGAIKTVTIKRVSGRWYVCFSVECAVSPLPASNLSIGIDVGLESFQSQGRHTRMPKTFAVLSDGTEILNPRHYRKAEARLRRCQRKVARRKKGSNRRRKAVLLLQRAHIHVRNQRADFHHKEASKLVNAYGVIAVEDLNIKGLARGLHLKSGPDAGWAQFLNYIAYKAEGAGREAALSRGGKIALQEPT